ncbi:HD domain-containing phosphohydrolase [Propionivibrio dicarboxylicus]|uniref:Putative two-component system response regulator n=1 Tax=Propionivibrio dicarboxylicus TaxID=83767 RepID=A0A1G7ZJN0_9RHOO|nr:HD domain-containing phosphohydrolase [Propionivibrio dicarboxylicus]SDH08815.1 putative two-component system response regulator [Propionivibrio dicarboxylicus]
MNRIAIIDDSEINRVLFGALVGKLGLCHAELFRDPVDGLAWCLAHAPDLIVVDYMMPDMDGIEFISRLRASPGMEDVPVLMITASDDRGVRHEALRRGASDFLTKPVDHVEFSTRVRNMLALSNGRRKLADRAAWLAEEVAKATEAVHAREQELLIRMSRAAEFRDPETGAHILRMAHYSRLIAEELGLPDDDCRQIFQASPMHDIGKIGIPDHILLKPGRLTLEEFEVMKRHAQIGHELLKGSASMILQAAATIAVSHHERFDGVGYPCGVVGEAIPLYGRVVAVADVFDALTSTRPYKPAWSLDEAAAYLRDQSAAHFDPACVDAFFSRWDAVQQIHAQYRDEVGKGG